MPTPQKTLEPFSRILASVRRLLRRMRLPDPATPIEIPPGIAACNVCGFVARQGNPRLCPSCGTNQRQRTFKQLFLARLKADVFGDGLLGDGLLLSPGEVERALLFPVLRRPVVSSLHQQYRGIGAFVRANVRDLAPFGDTSFDYVQACNVLDYVPQMEQALRAIHRVLRPRGIFVLLIPEGNLRPSDEPFSCSVRPRVTGDYWPDETAVPFVRVGRLTLRDLLQHTGFESNEIPLVDSLSQLQCTWWLCRRR